MKKAEFLKLVEAEAKHLRKNTTKQERDKLDLDTLNPDNIFHCIYGQLTGVCDGSRAKELKQNTPFKTIATGALDEDQVTFTGWKKKQKDSDDSPKFSPVEVYISMKGAKNKLLIAYIKREIPNFKA